MSIKIKNSEFGLSRKYKIPTKKVMGKEVGGHTAEVFLTIIIDYEKGKYWITQKSEEGVRFEKYNTVHEDIAKAELVIEALLFAGKEMDKINA